MTQRDYPDMWDHIDRLEEEDLLVRVDRRINKDTELHPLVRWQYRGGIDEEDRKAFLFTNIVDSQGREFDIPVIVGALAGNPEIYGIGIGAEPGDIPARWEAAIDNPIDPVEVDSSDAPIHDVVHTGADLEDGHGLDAIPVPVSTPGFDDAPYTTMSAGITHDPENGIRNFGMYRCQIKSPTRTGVFSTPSHGVMDHWMKARERGERLPVAFCVSAPPAVAYTGAQTLAMDVDELAVSGGLVGAPFREVEAKTIPVMVPADAEIVIEGHIPPDVLEPEGQFGESHGHLSMPEYGMVFEVSAITHREEPVHTSIISQVTPSESSTLKKVAMEPLFYNHLTKVCNLTQVTDVTLHEPLTNLRKLIIVSMDQDASPSAVWRAMYATVSLRSAHGKIVIAVDDDVDPDNLDAVFWAMSYRSNPQEDVEILHGRNIGATPKPTEPGAIDDSALLWDATLKEPLPPISLPRKEFMEQAREIWEELELPELEPERPWHGYSLGLWSEVNERNAQRAVESRYFETGEDRLGDRVSADEYEPNTRIDE